MNAMFENVQPTRGYLKWKFDGDNEYFDISTDELCTEMSEIPDGVTKPSSKNFKVNPNPVNNGMININLHSANNQIDIQITDLANQTHFQQRTNSNTNIQIDLQGGVYFVKIVAKNKVYSKKIIVFKSQ